MKYITDTQIRNLNISSQTMLDWVDHVIRMKKETILPPKISIHLENAIFYNTMPCVIPGLGIAGVKEVNRYPNNTPSLNSQMMIYDLPTGGLKCIMDASYITTIRTAAVAIHSVHLFAAKDYKIISFIGLGEVGSMALKIYIETLNGRNVIIRLFNYKNRARFFVDMYKKYNNISFEIFEDYESFIDNADVIVSAVTYQENDFTTPDKYKDGVLLVPVHTRGFTECDLVFDKIFGDDYGHICNFKYFNYYKYFSEITDVLSGNTVGRVNDNERIITYSIGIAIHDLYFGNKVFELLKDSE